MCRFELKTGRLRVPVIVAARDGPSAVTRSGGSDVKRRFQGAALAVAAVAGVSLSSAGDGQAFGDAHWLVTEQGLDTDGPAATFLRFPVLAEISKQHAVLDRGGGDLSTSGAEDHKHFDDCEFDGATRFIGARYREASYYLAQKEPFLAARQFGSALHPVQDFYSHSNWVEFGFPVDGVNAVETDLVDLSGAQLGLDQDWFSPGGGEVVRGDIVAGEDDWAPDDGWTVRVFSGTPKLPVLYNSDGGRVGRLLVTGEGLGDDECDMYRRSPFYGGWGSYVRIFDGFTHAFLNKDGEGRSQASERLYERAKSLARLQTSYEWCRLVYQAGVAGNDGLLLTTWVRSEGNPHPANTPCSEQTYHGLPSEPEVAAVTVTVERIKLLADHDEGGAGEIQLAAALYEDPLVFSASEHVTTSVQPKNQGESIRPGAIPAMTVCVPVRSPVTFAVYGWDNDNDEGRRAGDFDAGRGPLSGSVREGSGSVGDELLDGFQVVVDPTSAESQTERSDDLEVTFRAEYSDGVEGCGFALGPPPGGIED